MRWLELSTHQDLFKSKINDEHRRELRLQSLISTFPFPIHLHYQLAFIIVRHLQTSSLSF